MTDPMKPVDLEPPQDARMTTWVIYDHPEDFPDGYVLRPQYVVEGHKEVVPSRIGWYAADPDYLRTLLPPGLSLCPIEDPNPKILEVWW